MLTAKRSVGFVPEMSRRYLSRAWDTASLFKHKESKRSPPIVSIKFMSINSVKFSHFQLNFIPQGVETAMHFTNRFARDDFTSVNILVWTYMRSCCNLIYISWTDFKRIKLVSVSYINYSLFDDLSLKCFHGTTVIAHYSTGSNHRNHLNFFPPANGNSGKVMFSRLCLSFCLPSPHSTGTPIMFQYVQLGSLLYKAPRHV